MVIEKRVGQLWRIPSACGFTIYVILAKSDISDTTGDQYWEVLMWDEGDVEETIWSSTSMADDEFISE